MIYAIARAASFLGAHVVVGRAIGGAAPWVILVLAFALGFATVDEAVLDLDLTSWIGGASSASEGGLGLDREPAGLARETPQSLDKGDGTVAAGLWMALRVDGITLLAELCLGGVLGLLCSLCAAAVLGGIEGSLVVAGLDARASTLLTTWLAIVTLAGCLEGGLWQPAVQAWRHLCVLLPHGSIVNSAGWGTAPVLAHGVAACATALLVLSLSSATPVLMIVVLVDLVGGVLGVDQLGLAGWTRWLRVVLALSVAFIAWSLHLDLWSELAVQRVPL